MRRSIAWFILLLSIATICACDCNPDRRVPLPQENPPEIQVEEVKEIRFGDRIQVKPRSRALRYGDTEIKLDQGEIAASWPIEESESDRLLVLAFDSSRREIELKVFGDDRARRLFLLECEALLSTDSNLIDGALEVNVVVKRQSGVVEHQSWLLTLRGGNAELEERAAFDVVDVDGHETLGKQMALDWHYSDSDDDGHGDIRLDVTLPGLAIPFVWQNRPSGFVRDQKEPAATFERVIASLGESVDPQTGVRAKQLRDAFDFLCGVKSKRALRLGGALLRCADYAVAKQISLIADLHSDSFDTAFFAAASALEDGKKYKKAVDTRFPIKGIWSKVASTEKRAKLIWKDAQTLHMSSETAKDYSLKDGALTTAAAEALVFDPSRAWIVKNTKVIRKKSCAIDVELATFEGGRPLAKLPTISTLRAPIPVCEAPVTLLGWAPQGLLFVHLNALFVLPVTQAGRVGGEVIAIGDGPAPFPIQGAQTLRDASVFVQATRAGIIVHQRENNVSEYFRPKGYVGKDVDVAISPDERHIAVRQGKDIFLIKR